LGEFPYVVFKDEFNVVCFAVFVAWHAEAHGGEDGVGGVSGEDGVNNLEVCAGFLLGAGHGFKEFRRGLATLDGADFGFDGGSRVCCGGQHRVEVCCGGKRGGCGGGPCRRGGFFGAAAVFVIVGAGAEGERCCSCGDDGHGFCGERLQQFSLVVVVRSPSVTPSITVCFSWYTG